MPSVWTTGTMPERKRRRRKREPTRCNWVQFPTWHLEAIIQITVSFTGAWYGLYHPIGFTKMAKMTIASSKAKKLARRLLSENRNGRSYRTIAREDYRDEIDQSTLSRIARTKGEWLPKSHELLELLGLLTIRSPYGIMPRWWKRTPEALERFVYVRNQARIIANETRASQYAYKKVKQS